MSHPLSLSRRRGRALAVVASLAALAALAAGPAPAQSAKASGSAVESCERAARDEVSSRTGAGAEIAFGGATPQPMLSNESQTVLRGSGRWKTAAATGVFGYSCNVDPKTGEAIGVVVRVEAPPSPRAPAPKPPAEPDLSQLSPAACESSAVQMLQRRWPRVAQITFEPATRSFRQPDADRAVLHGSGLAVPQPGSPQTVFAYDCEIDPRDGRVRRTSLGG